MRWVGFTLCPVARNPPNPQEEVEGVLAPPHSRCVLHVLEPTYGFVIFRKGTSNG